MRPPTLSSKKKYRSIISGHTYEIGQKYIDIMGREHTITRAVNIADPPRKALVLLNENGAHVCNVEEVPNSVV